MSKSQNKTKEDRLLDLKSQLEILKIEVFTETNQTKKINSYNQAMHVIDELKKIIEEIKLDIVGLDENTDRASRQQLEKMDQLIFETEVPACRIDNVIRLLKTWKEIMNAIPNNATIHEDIGNPILEFNEDIINFK